MRYSICEALTGILPSDVDNMPFSVLENLLREGKKPGATIESDDQVRAMARDWKKYVHGLEDL